MCCCLVLFPIVWSIKQLRDASGARSARSEGWRGGQGLGHDARHSAVQRSVWGWCRRRALSRAAAAGSHVHAGPRALPPAAETDGKVVRTLVKLTLFRQFYIMVRACGAWLAGLGPEAWPCIAGQRWAHWAAAPSRWPCPACPRRGAPARSTPRPPTPRRPTPLLDSTASNQVVCYIYFTRIIVYLLENTLPFRHVWLAAAASELATLAFYIAAGWSFRCENGGGDSGCQTEQRLARLRSGGCAGRTRPPSPLAADLPCPPCAALPCRPMPAGANPYFQLTEEEAIELTKARAGPWGGLLAGAAAVAGEGARRGARGPAGDGVRAGPVPAPILRLPPRPPDPQAEAEENP